MKEEKLFLYLKNIREMYKILKNDINAYLNSDNEKNKRVNLELLENNIMFLSEILDNFTGDIDFYINLEK